MAHDQDPHERALAAEERLARETFEDARTAEQGEEGAAARLWALRCRALRTGHPRWAERLLSLYGQASAHLEAARRQKRAAVEQLEKIEQSGLRQKLERARRAGLAMKRASIAKARAHRPKPTLLAEPMVNWIRQRARQFTDEIAGQRLGARRIWEELRQDFREGNWMGVAERMATYEETRAIVREVRTGKAS